MPLAKIPRKSRFIQLKGVEKRAAFIAGSVRKTKEERKSFSTPCKESRCPPKENGIIIRTAKKKMRLVEAILL